MNSLICTTVNELLLTKSKDPRLIGVTITKAVISGDFRTVRIFYSLIGDQDRQTKASLALEKAKGFFRSHLASSLDQKYTPRIIFERDLNLEYAQHISQILSQINPANSDSTLDILSPNNLDEPA
jgi:ribosome-binding factor A